MASDKKLTRYTSAVTIVTADVMNSLYGGEYGYNDSVDGFHPLVFGHVHDGTHEDGHASKILLTNGAHVRGYLANANLGGTDGTTPAVRYSNIMCYSDATYGSPAARRAAAAAGGYDLEILAIPEYTEDPTTGEKCYYLDLSNSAGGIDGSIQYNENGSFSGNSDLFYDYTNLRFGAGTNTPQRKVHIVDNAHPPLRIEGITAGTGSVLVVDGNGDVYSDTSIGSQNLFESVTLSNAGGGTQTGNATITADTTTDTLTLSAGANITLDGDAANDTITISATQDAYKFIDLTGNTSGDTDIDATVPDDILTLTGGTGIRLDGSTAGQSIEINNTQQAFRTITRNQTGTGTSSGADVIADQINDTLTIEAGNNIDVTLDSGNDKVTISANVPAAETQFYSQWVGASHWVPVTGISGSRDPIYGSLSAPNRNITYKYVADNTSSTSDFNLTTSLPANGNLTGGNTTSTAGSHQGALTVYEDNIPNFPSDIAVECRITAYFILDGGFPGPEGQDAQFRVRVSYGSGAIGGGASIVATVDGYYLQDLFWNETPSSTPGPPVPNLRNNHSYATVTADGMIVVSDFSPLKITILEPKDGIVTFGVRVDQASGKYFGQDPAVPQDKIRLLGTRILWTW